MPNLFSCEASSSRSLRMSSQLSAIGFSSQVFLGAGRELGNSPSLLGISLEVSAARCCRKLRADS